MSRKRQDHCQRGHLIAGENVYVIPLSGRRLCVICRRKSRKSWDDGQRWRAKARPANAKGADAALSAAKGANDRRRPEHLFRPPILDEWPLTMCREVVWKTVRDEEIGT